MANTPIGGNDPRDPYAHYRVAAPEKEGRAKEDEKHTMGKPLSSEWPFFSAMLRILQKVVSFFDPKGKKGVSGALGQEIKKHLFALRRSLEEVTQGKNPSEAKFVELFSRRWHDLLDDAVQLGTKGAFAEEFLLLLDEIESYPKPATHSLGYYLAQHPGEKWLPAPLVELFISLVRDHEEKKSFSVLSGWMKRIDALLTL